ncbi:MAG: hypothetical protein O7D91_10875 [Planctomycetota bacterium]|nr:hypothetical protein [Planctomycetota bacterium]
MKCTAVEKVLAKLPGARQAGENQWLAKCPSHDDAKASLSVGLGDDGRALLRCHAGCAVESVVAAIGLKMADLMPNGQDATPTKAPAKPKTPNTMTAKSDPEAPPPWRRPIETTYDYTDEQGAVLFQAVRFGDGLFPRFMQRHQGNGNRWTWNIKGVRRVLYGLPMLLAADPHRRVFIVEGEKDVDRLLSLDMIATCNPMGAGSWLDEYSEHLKGRHCCIIADNDHPGRKHADEVVRSLQGVAAEARILELPGLPVAGDVSDWLDAGGTRDELKKLVKQTPVYGSDATEGPTKDDDSDGSDRSDDRKASKSGGRSQSSELVDLCEASGVEVFHEPGIGGDAYATIVVAGHRETYRLRSREFRRWLARQFWTSCGKAPNSQATQDALSVLAGKAHFECPECRVHLRLAEHDGAVYLDLGNGEWEAVEITPSGWRVVAEPPVRFRRTRGMRALPYPSTDGDIAALRPFLNLASNDAWILVTAFLLGTLKPAGPFPILVVNGEQGSCKSSLCRALRSLVDPNISDLRATPRDERDLVISANNGWLVAFDNLSHIRTWLSDALCRLATGGGFSTRELFTDQDEVILDVQRPIILNGIEELVTRGDLLDRSICITLPTIETGRRKTETEFWGAFERAKPRILGGLLNAVSTALKNVASTRLRLLPRMADFATWVVSAESALPFEAGAFMSAYNTNLN